MGSQKGFVHLSKMIHVFTYDFLDNSSTISISQRQIYTIYYIYKTYIHNTFMCTQYTQYIVYIYIYLYTHRIMYTYFYIPLPCLIAAISPHFCCRVKTNQGPQIHLRLVACGFSMSFCDLLFVFQKKCLFVFSLHVEYIYISIYFIVIFFLNFVHLEFIEWMLYTQGLPGLRLFKLCRVLWLQSHKLGCGIFTYICQPSNLLFYSFCGKGIS